ncbi:energy transducer TonB [Hymenobacter humi]|uniref:Energy transducer TonB n=1 Tax=Hymenobacter humi TaxID=1411620 RepID=A0ABW2U3G5_9BACT
MLRLILCAFLSAILFHPLLAQGQSQRGKLKDKKPVGVWEYYDGKDLGLRFDYDSGRAQYVRPDTSRYLVQIDGRWQLVHPSRAPRLIGSKSEVLSVLQRRLRYPMGDMRARTSGTVIVTVKIDEKGNVVDGKVTNASSTTLGNEVIRALEPVSLSFLPAIYQGKPVPFQVAFVVRFCFQSENANGLASKNRLHCSHRRPVTLVI